MNFPLHLNVHRDHLASALPPLILHHHGRTDARGFLLATKYGQANELIDRFNDERAKATGVPYPGLRRPRLGDRLRQELRMTAWYHSRPVSFVRALARNRRRAAEEPAG
jgi:hypothetical protein